MSRLHFSERPTRRWQPSAPRLLCAEAPHACLQAVSLRSRQGTASAVPKRAQYSGVSTPEVGRRGGGAIYEMASGWELAEESPQKSATKPSPKETRLNKPIADAVKTVS